MLGKGHNGAKRIADRIATLLRSDRCTVDADFDWQVNMIAPPPVGPNFPKHYTSIPEPIG